MLGAPGGSRIITMVLLGILGYDAGLTPQQVAALPRYPPPVDAGRDLGREAARSTPDAVEGAAKRWATRVNGAPSRRWGNLQTVEWDRATNTLSGGSDPRNPVGKAEVAVAADRKARRSQPKRYRRRSRTLHNRCPRS